MTSKPKISKSELPISGNMADQPEMFSVAAGVRPIDGQFATAEQLHPFTGMDEPQLRRLTVAINPATGVPWIPKPNLARFALGPTLMGVNAWLRNQNSKRAMPDEYSSMEDCDRRRHLPKIVIQYAREKGCAGFHPSNRFELEPVLKFIFDDLAKLFSGDPEKLAQIGIEGLKGLDYERERLIRINGNTREREEALAMDKIQDRSNCEQRLRIELLMPLRDGLQGLLKKYHRLKESSPAISVEILTQDLPRLLENIISGCVASPIRINEISYEDKTGNFDEQSKESSLILA